VGNTIPTGWALCEGQSGNKNDPKWAPLFEAIGTIHGGDGNPMFKLPDYRGMFLRGVDNGAGRDPDAAGRAPAGENNTGNSGDKVGSVQTDGLRSHDHTATVNDPGHTHFYQDHAQPAANTFDDGDRRGLQDHRRESESSRTGISVSIAANGGGETRPVNANVHWMIRVDPA